MRKLFSYTVPYKMAITIALLLTGLELAVELVQPVLMAKIIDEGISEQDMTAIYIWGSVLLALSLLAFVAGIINSFYSSQAGQGVGHDLRKDLFAKIQQFSFVDFQALPTSSLITRLTNDITQIQNFLFMSLRIALRAPLFILGGMIMAFTVNVQLATILFIAVVILLVIVLAVIRKGINLFQLVQKHLDKVNRVIQENLVGMRLIKAYTRGKHEMKRFKEVNRRLLIDNQKALQIMEMTMPILMFGMNVACVVIVWFGADLLSLAKAEAGEVVAVLNYATKIMFSFTVFSFVMMNYTRSKASSERLVQIFERDTRTEEIQLQETPIVIQGKVEFKHVSYKYSMAKQLAIQNLSFVVEASKRVGILGETGSGKTTIFQLIPRFFDPDDGQILIDDRSVTEYDRHRLRQTIGLVPQEAHLFTGSIADNIRWGKEEATDDEVIEVAKAAQIHDYIMSLPNQYETKIGQRGMNLSGGQKQRLAIARALVRKPAILLMDDSTSALDAKTEALILNAIAQMNCTTFLIAQKISSVMSADQILLIHEGELVANGTHKELVSTSAEYQRIYHSQMQKELEQLA